VMPVHDPAPRPVENPAPTNTARFSPLAVCENVS